MVADGFALHSAGGVSWYSCLALDGLSTPHGFSTRAVSGKSPHGDSLNLGFLPWDAPERVAQNRNRFFAALGLASARIATLSQIHSDRVHIIRETADQGNRPEGDALVTQRPGVAIGVLVADCFPVLLADCAGRTVAAVHSGWRGTASRIVVKTVEAMQANFDCRPDNLFAAIGPGIRSCCFEVGLEVARLIAKGHPGVRLVRSATNHPGKFMVDMPRALRIQLLEAGLRPDRVFDLLGACTRCNPREFFSYRAEGALAGRQMAVISPISN